MKPLLIFVIAITHAFGLKGQHVASSNLSSLYVCENGGVMVSGFNFREDTAFLDSVPFQQYGLPPCTKGAQTDLTSAVIDHDGTLWMWGDNRYGLLGLGDTINRPVPVKNPYLKSLRTIYSQPGAYYAIDSLDQLWIWGGLVGDSTANSHNKPYLSWLSNVAAVSSYSNHILVLRNDGTVWAWGSNDAYQLGNPTDGYTYYPKQINGLSGIRSIAAGDKHSMVADSAGNVWAWGVNQNGAFGDITLAYVQVVPAKLSTINDVKAVGAGNGNSYFLKNDGSVWASGSNGSGELGADSSVSVAYVPIQVNGINIARQLAVGQIYAMALLADNSVRSWGSNYYGNLGDGTRTSRYTPVQFLSSCSESSVTENNLVTSETATPNPSVGVFTLSGNLKASEILQLTNALGQEVPFVVNAHQIDLTGQPKGLYYLKSNRRVWKLVLE